MSNNRADWLFEKGQSLPDSRTRAYSTVVPLRRNEPYHETDNVIRVPLIEGNNPRADRNRRVLAMEIKPDDPRVKRDVPLGSEIEVTVSIDESRTTKMRAFIPILDEDFGEVCRSLLDLREPEELRQELERQKERLEELRRKANQMQDRKALAALDRIDKEQIVDQVTRQVLAAQRDPDARPEADKKLLDLRAAVDSVEDALKWPGLVQEAREHLESTRGVVSGQYGRSEERQRLQALEADVERAIDEERVELLRSRIENLCDLGGRVVVRDPAFWIGYLEYLQERRGYMDDQAAADRLFAQAQRAINSNDVEPVKGAVRQLIALLPPVEREAAEARGRFRSTIIRR